jgi:hypothetical protein
VLNPRTGMVIFDESEIAQLAALDVAYQAFICLRCCPRSGWVAAMLAWERADFYFNGKVN